MGQLIYAGTNIGLSDSVLAHLEALTRHVLAEGKSFAVVIQGADDDGVAVARTLWVAPQIPILFAYQDYETVHIDRDAFGKLYESVIDSGVHYLGDGPLPYKFAGGEAED